MLCFLFKEPTPITAMELSTKQVRLLEITLHQPLAESKPCPNRLICSSFNSNSCTSGQIQGFPRCPCTVVRSTGRPVPSAAWQEIHIVPGTGLNALDIFPLLRGKHILMNLLNILLLYYFSIWIKLHILKGTVHPKIFFFFIIYLPLCRSKPV